MNRMISPASVRGTAPHLLLLLCIALAGSAAAEPVRADNPAEAAEGVVTARLTELWRAGGEDSDLFFGNVSATRVDALGNVLLMDSQLSEVHILDAEGQLIRTICGEGDGPGEVRQPNDLLIAADGTVCVLQGFPGRIVKLTPEGIPAGDAKFSTGDMADGQFAVLVRGLALPDGMLLAGIQMTFGGGALSDQNYFLAACDNDGLQQRHLHGKVTTINYADLELTELGMDFIWSRVAAGSDGTIFAAPDRNAYEILVYSDGADPARVITRPFRTVERNGDQKAIQRRILEGIGANYPAPLRRTVVEDTQPIIAGMWATDDGLLWVQTSPGVTPVPEGAWTVLDVFDARGRFLRQVALPGPFDAERDGLNILRDGRIIVTIDALEAFLNQQAVAGDPEATEAEPLEVICFELEL